MASINAGAVFRKTAKGIEEIDKRTARLGIKLRMALILVNGQRDAAEIITDVRENGEALLAELLAGGFIEPASGASGAAAGAAPPSVAPSASSVGAADLKTAQRTAVKAVEELLGPEGESIALKIERCKTEAELQAVLEKTRDLIRMSRGAARAQKFWDALTRKG
jgi:hypothetical protein